MARETRKVLTLHAPIGGAIAQNIVDIVDATLREDMGAGKVWISLDQEIWPDIVIMAELEVPDPPSRRRRAR